MVTKNVFILHGIVRNKFVLSLKDLIGFGKSNYQQDTHQRIPDRSTTPL